MLPRADSTNPTSPGTNTQESDMAARMPELTAAACLPPISFAAVRT